VHPPRTRSAPPVRAIKESIFRIVFAGQVRFGGIFRRFVWGRRLKKGRQLFWQEKVHPQSKSWLRLCESVSCCCFSDKNLIDYLAYNIILDGDVQHSGQCLIRYVGYVRPATATFEGGHVEHKIVQNNDTDRHDALLNRCNSIRVGSRINCEFWAAQHSEARHEQVCLSVPSFLRSNFAILNLGAYPQPVR